MKLQRAHLSNSQKPRPVKGQSVSSSLPRALHKPHCLVGIHTNAQRKMKCVCLCVCIWDITTNKSNTSTSCAGFNAISLWPRINQDWLARVSLLSVSYKFSNNKWHEKIKTIHHQKLGKKHWEGGITCNKTCDKFNIMYISIVLTQQLSCYTTMLLWVSLYNFAVLWFSV